jgi:hypothetical protein
MFGGKIFIRPLYCIHGKAEDRCCFLFCDLMLPGIQEKIEFIKGDAEKEFLVRDREAEGVGAWGAVNDFLDHPEVFGKLINLVFV